MLLVNEKEVFFHAGMTLADLVREQDPVADILLVNGYPASLQAVLSDGDRCWLWQRGKSPSAEEMRHLLYARHSPGVQGRLQERVVGIMGLGGLGSVVAIALARMGIGSLLLADYDVVEPTNLNRQQYFVDQIGEKKTAALRDILQRVNPHVAVTLIDRRLAEEDIGVLFKGVHALVECFDDPDMKAAGLRAALHHLPGVFYVGASGLAGYGENNAIRTRLLYPGVYLVGDGVSGAAPGQGLMAARVGIAAHHQANQVVRLLLGAENEVE
jgi:sulfur carrier protein ThiS adenylyltransferase